MFVVYSFSYPNYKPRYFETERGAKIARGRNNANPKNFQCGVLSLEHYNHLFGENKVKVKNLMTGAIVEILEQDRGTVNDPSQERYFTM